MTGKSRTAGFRLLYNPTPSLGEEEAELAFVVERPHSAYRFEIWTRHGCRTGTDAASLETWMSVYEEHSQTVQVPAWLENLVLQAWAAGEGTDDAICRALARGVQRLEASGDGAPAGSTPIPATAGEGIRR